MILKKLLHFFQVNKQEKEYLKVRVNFKLTFRKYSAKDEKVINSLKNTLVEVERKSDFFYKIRKTETLIFFMDFTEF